MEEDLPLEGKRVEGNDSRGLMYSLFGEGSGSSETIGINWISS